MVISFGKLSILVLATVIIVGCKHPTIIDTSFYYWKTVYQNDSLEQHALRQLNSRSLYVRIMDVDRIDDASLPIPISPIRFNDKIPASIAIVPVVFIVNSVFKQISDGQIKILSNRVLNFVAAKVKQAGKPDYDELQIDCDWTAGSRDSYFLFLQALQQSPAFKGKRLSATLRLHQVKNKKRSGIPPVDKVLLMCYNMGNLRQYGHHNSIFDMKEMETYLEDHLKSYPLKMDVALPLFSWKVVFRNKEYVGISKRLRNEQLRDSSLFARKNHSSLFQLKKDLPNLGLQSADMIRNEEINLSDLYQASDFLSRYLPATNVNLIFYHLDKDILYKFSNDDLQEISNRF